MVHEVADPCTCHGGVRLGHHGRRLKGVVGDLSHRQLLVVGLLGGDDWSVG
jgi:hypothetical protein